MIKAVFIILLVTAPLNSAVFDTLNYCKFYLIKHLVTPTGNKDAGEINIALNQIEEVMNLNKSSFSITNIYNNESLNFYMASISLKDIPLPHYPTDIIFYFGLVTVDDNYTESFQVNKENILNLLNYYKPEIKNKNQFAEVIKLLTNFEIQYNSVVMDSLNDDNFSLIKNELNLYRIGDISQDGSNFNYKQYEKIKSDNSATYYLNWYIYENNILKLEKTLLYKVVEN